MHLIVASKPAIPAQPSEGSFDHPTAGQRLESTRGLLHDLYVRRPTDLEPGAPNASTSQLSIRSLTDGKLLHGETLPVPTVDHGLATANGRLYLSMDDGTLMCME